MKIDTLCVQSGYEPKTGEPRVLPIYQSTTYYYDTPEQLAHLFDSPKNGHIYSRISNPTVSAAEAKLAALEGGVAAMACASGQSATTLAILTLAASGDNFISASTIYGGTYNLFNVTLRKLGIDCKFFKPDAQAKDIERLIDDKTKFMFVETLANPAMTVINIKAMAKICNKYGIVLIVDNTLATPIYVRPLEQGAHVVIHSSTKYLDGHAQAVGGIIVDGGNFKFDGNPRYKDFYIPDESYHGVKYTEEGGAAAYILKARMQYMRDIGAIMSPFNAYLTNLGTETLHLRMRKHTENAKAVAKMLAAHPKVEWVKYAGFSGMVCFGLKGGEASAVKFIKGLKLFKQVTHIADARSCVLHPATTTHRQLGKEDLEACGIGEDLIRLSVGIEDAADILQDLTDALN